MLHRDQEAEEHFRRAISLAPQDSQSYFFYGRWLHGKARILEAVSTLNQAAALNSAALDPRYLLMLIYSRQFDSLNLKRVTDETLRVAPADPEALRYAASLKDANAWVADTERRAAAQPTAENYLGLSQLYYQNGHYDECIHAAQEALRLRPNYAEAYNNVAAGYQATGRWDEAIEAAQKAIGLKQDFQLARNNLAYALSQKSLGTKKELIGLVQQHE
jgi:tetratricopeptide (TPR) repeat protein